MSANEEPATLPLLPLATQTLRLFPNEIVPAVADSPYVVHFTMAAIDPLNPSDEKKTPSTLRLIRIEDSDEDEDEDEDNEPEDTEPVTLLTLGPGTAYQQPIDLYIAPTEGLTFQVIGSYPIHLTGNIVDHPITQELLDEQEEEDDEEDDEDDDEEEDDEEIPDAIDIEALDDASDDSEDSEEEEQEESESESESEDELDDIPEKPKDIKAEIEASKKRSSPDASSAQDKKKVKFSEKLEKGPEATESKFATKKLQGGVVIEDRKIGDGPSARVGSRVSMRYVGKLANGKIFDKNTAGKPFTFMLGRAEVIRGWDVGIDGMKAGGERRIIIPAPMAYGKSNVPGIPRNSELRFDVKCLSIK